MPSPPSIETPNVLLLFVDQLRFDALRCAGNAHIRTPNLDRLAASGVRFDRAYTSVPVCIAARHALLYGQRCAATGRFANNVPSPEPLLFSLPQLLANAGYDTRAIGKMHWRPVRRHHGFDRMELMEEIPDHRGDDEFLLHLQANGHGHVRAVHGIRHLLYQMPQTSCLPQHLHGSTWVADRTIEYLRSHHHRPFFCWSSWISPHPPFNVPRELSDLYANDEVPPPHNPDRAIETLPASLHRLKNVAGVSQVSRDCWQRIRALYYAQVSLIDDGIGRILHALDELDLADNTLVIFAADHGEMLGDQGLWQKSQPYDGSARVPFLMRLPGRTEAGRVSQELVSLLDILPTCLQLSEQEHPAGGLAGASLLGADGGGLARPRERLVIEHGRPPGRWLSLLREGLKYNLYLDDGWEELYDLGNDPHEDHNLLLGERPPVADGMRSELLAWEITHGFPESVADGKFKVGERRPPASGYAVNMQLPRWLGRLPADERALMNSLGAEMAEVMALEDSYSLDDLDTDQWVARGGPICAAALAYLRGSGW